MMIGEIKSGACLLLSLPEDVFAVISRLLSPTDLCNLSLCCKSLSGLVGSEKIWLVQCEVLKVLPLSEILQWRKGISSYKALCRFLVEVMKPLVGLWVHQGPELGNVVCVMPGFLSVVGCRIIPQKVGPLGIQEGRVLWSPVFEIICSFDGSPEFFLHGRDGKVSCLYPCFVMGIEKSCNLLELEVEPRREKKLCSEAEGEASGEALLGGNKGDVRYGELSFRYRNYLLDLVTSYVGLPVSEPLIGKLFLTPKDGEAMLLERRTMLLRMQKFGGNWEHMNLEDDAQLCSNPMLVDVKELRENLGDDINSNHFLSSSDKFGLSFKASYTEISSRKGWPIMDSFRFVLYKLPMKDPVDNQDYAGLWGGTFGWPPGKSTGKALFLLMLSYEKSQKDSHERLLIGTKILEGANSVKYRNGSAMFVVNMDSPSLEPFPFDADGRNFEHSYTGNGIANGYLFRTPGSEPGSLFVISSDLLAFVWQETEKVFTFQRLNLEEILKKGLDLCVPPLPPTMNFTYTKRY